MPLLPARQGKAGLITRIRGRLVRLHEDAATVEAGAFDHQVLVPEFNRRQLQGKVDTEVELNTIEYLEGNPVQGRLTPRMIGFLSDVEREFFELFCSVDGVGVKKALRAMVRPVREVAGLIEKQDAKGLSALPGVGPATADRIIAKLRRKVPKFALMVARDGDEMQAEVPRDVVSATYEVLRSLGHTEADAHRLLDEVLTAKKKFKDVEGLLEAVYQHSHTK